MTGRDMTGRAGYRRRAGTRLVATAAALGLLAGCGGPRNVLNTASSHCFRALPPARATVGDHGRLVGVRSVLATRLARNLPQAAPLDSRRLCVIAFRGPYVAGQIPLADPPGPGTYAIVAVDNDGETVLASFIVSDLPLRFRHRL
jgi:hypothetical protein